MADELPTAILKRVMSKPETHGDEKKSKKMMGSSGDEQLITDGEAAAAIDKMMLEGASSSGVGDDKEEEEGVAAPFPNVHVKRELSNDTTHSSLSDGEGGGGGISSDIRKEGDVVKVPTFKKNDNPSNNHQDEVAAPSIPSNNNNNKSIMTRQVSHDGSEANRSRSSSSSENGNRPSSVGNWGWFEDVHGHESAFLPGLMGGNGSRNASRDNSMNRNRRGSTDNNGSSGSNSASKKKKGGLLHIGSELMSNVIQAFNEPQRGKSLYFCFFHFDLMVVDFYI